MNLKSNHVSNQDMGCNLDKTCFFIYKIQTDDGFMIMDGLISTGKRGDNRCY